MVIDKLNSPTTMSDKEIATDLKKKFDEKYSPGTWQAIVGSCFGCSLTHKTKFVLHFSVVLPTKTMYVLIFCSAD
jgi:hypothetical protein